MGWTNTGLVVRRGQRLRLPLGQGEPGPEPFCDSRRSGEYSRPRQTNAQSTDWRPDCPSSGRQRRLHFVGRSRDFVAQRDGVLFLGVNEGNLSDNSGLFEVVIEAEAANPR